MYDLTGRDFFILLTNIMQISYQIHTWHGFSGRHTWPRWEMAGKFLLHPFFLFFQISLKFFQNYLLSFEIIKRNQNFFILLSFLQNSVISFKNEFIWDIWHDITNPSHSFQSVIFLHSSKTTLSLIPVHWWKFL